MKMKRSQWILLAAVAIVILLTGIVAWFFGTYTWVGGVRYRKDAQTLDLSGTPAPSAEAMESFHELKSLDLRGTGVTVEAYEQIKASHPDCQIRWDVPFQGSFLAEDATEVTVTSLTEEDVAALSYVKTLETVESSACQDYAQLAQLQRALPEAVFTHKVPLAGQNWANDEARVVLKDADGDAMLEQLSWLPKVKEVKFRGKLPTPEQLAALQKAYPDVDFSWRMELDGTFLEKDSEILDLMGKQMDADDLETLLAYGPGLKKLVVTGSGMTDEELMDLQEKHPEVLLVWDIEVEGRTFRRDATELDFSNIPMTDVSQAEKWFPYFPNLERVDMSYTGLSNEELDALNKKYEDFRIVWLVKICDKGGIMTDATYFMPYQLGTIVTDKEMELLKYCPDLVCVDVGHMKIYNCDFVKYLPKLRFLIVADTYVDSLEPLRGHENLIFLEAFLTKVTDYTPLLDCPNLLDLNITNNFGDLTPLTKMTWLERLWVSPLGEGSYKNMPEVQMLRDALPNTQVEYCQYSTGLDWRKHPRYYEMRDILGMFYLT